MTHAATSAGPTVEATRRAPTTARPSPTVHFPCFDGYRAVAAATVVVTHVSFFTVVNRFRLLGPYFARFDIGVSFFFLISGFLLYRPFAVAALRGSTRPALRPYLRRRALRIIPAYWGALTLAFFVFRVQSHVRLGDAAFYYGFAQIYDSHHILGGLSPAWSLDTEVAFYLFVPVWAALTMRAAQRATTRDQRFRAQLYGVAFLYAVSFVWRLWVMSPLFGSGFTVGPFHVADGCANVWLPAMLDYFALGMLLAVVRAWRSEGGSWPAPRLASAAGRAWVWWVLGGLTFWFVSRHIGLPLDVRPYGNARLLERQTLYGLTAFCLLVPGVFGDQGRGVVRGVLKSRVFRWVGLVSYGVYLWHELWLHQVQQWTGLRAFTGHFGSTLLAVSALSLATAGVSYVVVERPIMRR